MDYQPLCARQHGPVIGGVGEGLQGRSLPTPDAIICASDYTSKVRRENVFSSRTVAGGES